MHPCAASSSKPREHPKALQFRSQHRLLKYSELQQRSNQLAQLLRSRGIGRGAMVGLCVERSLDMVIAQLAILKSGAAYVPLDPAYPQDRLAAICEDAQMALLVTESEIRTPHLAAPQVPASWTTTRRRSHAQSAAPLAPESAPRCRTAGSGLRHLHVGFDGQAQGRRRAAWRGGELPRQHGQGTGPESVRHPGCRHDPELRHRGPRVAAAAERRRSSDSGDSRRGGRRPGAAQAAGVERRLGDASHAVHLAHAARSGLAWIAFVQGVDRRRGASRRLGGSAARALRRAVEHVRSDRDHRLVKLLACAAPRARHQHRPPDCEHADPHP